MKRFKLYAMATLLAIPVANACGDDVVSPAPTGSITGQVSIEGQGIDGVTVALEGGTTATTASGGTYRFDDLEAGTYTITISNYPADGSFNAASASATLEQDGEVVTVNFTGSWIRTSAIMGIATVESDGLSGLTVKISGMSESEILTGANGEYAFSGLRAGDYTIEISGFDPDDVSFDDTSSTATVAVDESKVVNFEGTYVRTSGIIGLVSVEGSPLEGVTVILQGGGEDRTEATNGAGRYAFEALRSGNYSVAISGYDGDEYGFEDTSRSVAVASGETADVPFEGTALRTASMMGAVTVAGEPHEGVTVSLSGEGEDRSVVTSAAGQYAFERLRAGDYSIRISGYDADEYEFDASRDITVELGESATANFTGRSLRTAGIVGIVSVESEGLADISVTLVKVLGPDIGEVIGEMVTDEDGGYGFADLLAAIYRIEIAGFDEEHDFPATRWQGAVATDETAEVNFDASIIRTAGVSGVVAVNGGGLMGVKVTLTGDQAPRDYGIETGTDGSYVFDGLRKGSYVVSIKNPDEDMYDFPAVSRRVSLAVGQAKEDVSFEGKLLRRASIGGQVLVEGDPIEGVTVTLAGDADANAMTDGSGRYSFPGLAGGNYTVSVENPDEKAYEFDDLETDVELGDDEMANVDFDGRHTTTASIRGMLFLDEIKNDGVLTGSEPSLARAGIELLLHGPGAQDVVRGVTDATGAYRFEGLKAGSYRVLVAVSDTLTALAEGGYDFIGETTGQAVELAAAASETANFPFRITRQTILVGAVMGNATETGDPVGGVRLALYPTAEDAANGTNSLGTATTAKGEDEAGLATFEFARKEDVGQGGEGTDHLVFVKATGTGHADLALLDDSPIEVSYAATARAASVPAAVRMLNTRVNFQWWVKSDARARDGNRFLPGWVADNGVATDDEGKATYSGTVAVSGLPATFPVALEAVQEESVDLGERWEQSAALAHVHDGLGLPADNSAADNDLGAIYVTWKTQALVVGVYREADDVPGYTRQQSRVPGGDHRPVPSVGTEMTVELLALEDGDVLERYTWDHDDDDETADLEGLATVDANGLVRFAGIPADEELAIRFKEGEDRIRVTELGDVESFSGDLDIGATVGAFGAMSGGVPEVRICSASEGTSDHQCATWGYQWATGTISGRVGTESGYAIDLDPTTDGHGAAAKTTTSGRHGAYSLTGLQDGEYAITASGTSTYKVDGEPTQSVWVYHDETTDDDDRSTTYVGTAGRDEARWTTTRIGLKILGYIGNDASGDKRMRGDEALAGVAVRLFRGPETVATVSTDDRGFYAFEGLEQGRYGVEPDSGSDYIVLRGFDPESDAAIATATATADEYPVLREGKYRLPSWDYENNRANNTSVKVRKPGSTNKATLVNFALVYTDGELSGEIENVSGSAADIDLRIYRERDDQVTEVTTDSRGRFEAGGLEEGSYRVEIADARFAAPCLVSATGAPDDDGPDADADGECDHMGALQLDADLRGRQDRASLPVLHAYDRKLFANDSLGDLPGIKARQQGSYSRTYNDTVTWDPGWARTPNSEQTRNTNRAGIISWASKSVTFSFPDSGSIREGASVVVMKDTIVCADHACELDYNRTGTPGPPARETTLTVTVTAENGYDDHIYSVVVARTNPVGNGLFSDRARRHNADDTYTDADGYGTFNEPYTLQTDSAAASSLRLHVDLRHLGVPDLNAACAQSLIVKDNADEEIEAEADAKGDICEDERYTLSVAEGGSRYTLRVFSEDGVEKVHHLALSRGPGD